jgi:hypothetical protein
MVGAAVELDDEGQRGPGLSDPCNGKARPLAGARAALVPAALPVAEQRGRAGSATAVGVEE